MSPVLYLNTLIPSGPLSAARPLHGRLRNAPWPPATLTECCLTYVSVSMEKSRGWFASSGTGGVVYNCGAIVEVNVKSMDEARVLASSTVPQGVMSASRLL